MSPVSNSRDASDVEMQATATTETKPIAVFSARQFMGIVITTVALNAYLLDAYPEGSGEVSAWTVLKRTFGGFLAIYVEIDCVNRVGLLNGFGTQAGIAGASALSIIFLGLYGRRIKLKHRDMRSWLCERHWQL